MVENSRELLYTLQKDEQRILNKKIIVFPLHLFPICCTIDNRSTLFLTEYITKHYHETGRRRTSVYADGRRDLYKQLKLDHQSVKVVSLRANNDNSTLEIAVMYTSKHIAGKFILIISADQNTLFPEQNEEIVVEEALYIDTGVPLSSIIPEYNSVFKVSD